MIMERCECSMSGPKKLKSSNSTPSSVTSTIGFPAASGRTRRVPMCTENVSPGPASSVGTETDPLPAASGALTIKVMLRIRFWPELRRDNAAFTSIRFAPRAVAFELPKSAESRLTGESLGKSILWLSPCACRESALTAARAM